MTSTIAWRLAVRRPPAPTSRATISSTVMGPPSAAALTGPAVLVWSCAPLLRLGARSLTHLRQLGVEGHEQQLLVEEEHSHRASDRHPAQHPQVGARDAQDVAEQGSFEVAGEVVAAADHRHPEGERGGGDDADGGVGADLSSA